MDIEQLKKSFTNVGANYDFFDFNYQGSGGKRFSFPIKKLDIIKNYKATHFYKPLTRLINLENNTINETESNQTI